MDEGQSFLKTLADLIGISEPAFRLLFSIFLGEHFKSTCTPSACLSYVTGVIYRLPAGHLLPELCVALAETPESHLLRRHRPGLVPLQFRLWNDTQRHRSAGHLLDDPAAAPWNPLARHLIRLSHDLHTGGLVQCIRPYHIVVQIGAIKAPPL